MPDSPPPRLKLGVWVYFMMYKSPVMSEVASGQVIAWDDEEVCLSCVTELHNLTEIEFRHRGELFFDPHLLQPCTAKETS